MKYNSLIVFTIFLISSYFFLNCSFAACELTANEKNISINTVYNISGIFICEKINLSDYNCIENDIYWWNGTIWMKNASVGCTCIYNSECQTNFCLKGICSYNISSSKPKINFVNKTLNGSKDTLMRNIIIIKNRLNQDDVFNVKISHNNSPAAKSIYMFSHISGNEFGDDNKFAQYKIAKNTTKKIMLITTPIQENVVANLTASVCSHSTGLCATDTAQYNITEFKGNNFLIKATPDIGFIAFSLICVFGCFFTVNKQ